MLFPGRCDLSKITLNWRKHQLELKTLKIGNTDADCHLLPLMWNHLNIQVPPFELPFTSISL